MTTSLLIPDVSEWQGPIDWAKLIKAAYPAVIIRAYNGTRADHQWAANRSGAHAHGVRALGLYAYLEPGTTEQIEHQAAAFVSLVGSLRAGEWPICDYEATKLTPAMLKTWLSYVAARLHGSEPWAYTGEYLLRSEKLSAVVPAHRTWVAAYGPTEPSEGHELWQYTDHRTVPGVSGGVDCSTFHGSVEQLLAAVGAPATPSKPSAPAPGPTAHASHPYPKGIAPGRSVPSAEPLQAALQATGWMPKNVRRSPHYGPATSAGVAGFNDKHHMNSTGTAHDPAIGPHGWALLMTLAYGAG
jgi:GH25 family lysozyme M1 (1,4-beta-N-acetylmuramidase)